MRKVLLPVTLAAIATLATLAGGEAASAAEAGRYVIAGGRY